MLWLCLELQPQGCCLAKKTVTFLQQASLCLQHDTCQRRKKNICQGGSERSQCHALSGERAAPFSDALCMCVFSSLRATYTSIFPFTLVMPSVFTGSSSQPCLAAFPLLLFSTKNQRGCQITCDQGQPVCHFDAGMVTGSCLKKPRQAAQDRPNSDWALPWFPIQLCSSCVNFPCSKPRRAVPAANCIRQQGLSQVPSPP